MKWFEEPLTGNWNAREAEEEEANAEGEEGYLYTLYTFKSGEECGHQRIGAFQDNKNTLESVFERCKCEEHRAS